MAHFKPVRVGLKIRVNENRMRAMIAAGFELVQRDTRRTTQIIEKHEAAAAERGVEAYRGGRTDATGVPQPDSGTPIFTWGKEGRVNVTLAQFEANMTQNGFVLSNVNVLRKTGDHMGFLCLWYVPASAEITPVVLTTKQRAEIEPLLGSVYGHLHGFRNPDLSMTFNAAHREQVPAERVLRIDPEWSVTCQA